MIKKVLKNLKHFLVPHKGNEHRPLVLRPKSLRAYAYFLITVKVLVTLLLCSFYPSPAFLSLEIQDKIIDLVNQTRQEKALSILEINNNLSLAAQAKAEDMIDRDYFAHTSPDGQRSWEWVSRDKYYYLAFGENLAMDFTSAQTAHVALMNSPSHAKNILNSKYADIGIGVASGEMQGRETIVLVQFFGKAKEAVAAAVTEGSIRAVEEREVKSEPVLKTDPSTRRLQQDQPTSSGSSRETVKAEEVIAEEPASAPSLPLGASAGEEEIYIDRNLTDTSPIIVRVAETEQAKDFLNRIILYTDWLLWGFLIFLMASLLINVFVRIQIQSPVLIAQSYFVILVVLSLLLFKVHFIEEIIGRVISLV